MDKSRDKKLAQKILFLVVVAVIISLFAYFFLKSMAYSLMYDYCEKTGFVMTVMQEMTVESLIENGSLLVGVFLFIFLFLFLVGRILTEAIHQIREKEKELWQDREMLIRALSHDIRTPLTAIRSYTEYMQEKENISQEEMKEYLDLMEQKADQMKALTDSLLENSKRNPERIEHGRLFMEQLVMEWEEGLEEHFTCTTDLKDCGEFVGEIDVAEFRRIFDNLSSNIEKYADKEYPVELWVETQDKNLMIRQKNKVRNDLADVESHGIGLLSIKSIASHYDGEVRLEQEGDRFFIEIHMNPFL